MTDALKALQRWYDYDRIDTDEFRRRYPNVVEEARAYLIAGDCHGLAERAESHINLYLDGAARNALEAMMLVEPAS